MVEVTVVSEEALEATAAAYKNLFQILVTRSCAVITGRRFATSRLFHPTNGVMKRSVNAFLIISQC